MEKENSPGAIGPRESLDGRVAKNRSQMVERKLRKGWVTLGVAFA